MVEHFDPNSRGNQQRHQLNFLTVQALSDPGTLLTYIYICYILQQTIPNVRILVYNTYSATHVTYTYVFTTRQYSKHYFALGYIYRTYTCVQNIILLSVTSIFVFTCRQQTMVQCLRRFYCYPKMGKQFVTFLQLAPG